MKLTKTLRLCVLLLMAVSVVYFAGCSKQDMTMDVAENVLKAKVTLVIGKAYILRDDRPAKIKIKKGLRILPNDVIITGKESGVNIVIVDRGIFKIKENSNVSLKNLTKVDDANNAVIIKVTAGKIVLGLQKLRKNSTFEVETPTAVAGVRGTSFMVTVDEKETSAFPYFVKVQKKENLVTKIAVLTGKVELINPKNASDNRIISSLKLATLKNDDFKNLKIEKITMIALNEIDSIKDMSEIKKLKLQEISEEIKSTGPAVEELMKSELKTKAAIKSKVEDLSQAEKAIEDIKAKKEAIKKMKRSGRKSEGKYLEDEQGW